VVEMADQIAQKVLLTGAGFTHNFGTPLASGMWSEILNNRRVRETPSVRDRLLANFDFEAVYNVIVTGQFTDEEKAVITEAVAAAYAKSDDILMAHRPHLNVGGLWVRYRIPFRRLFRSSVFNPATATSSASIKTSSLNASTIRTRVRFSLASICRLSGLLRTL
jgi:hypothetical protein